MGTLEIMSELAWADKLRDAVNSDVEMAAIGRHCDVRFYISSTEYRVHFVVRAGKIVEINSSPRIDSWCDFGFSAPPEVWAKFRDPARPAIYHSLFAMVMRVPEFRLEGDTLRFAQNARAMLRIMTIFQDV
jgi:hypothetical protein